MPSCLHELVAALWIGFTGKYRLQYADRALEAEDQLQTLLKSLDQRDAALAEQQETLMKEVHSAHKIKNRARCKQKYTEYKRLEVQRQRLTTYKEMVMAHIDALNNTELNKALISTLQESSKTLKAMGVVDGVKQAELVVADVENSMAQVQELTQVLGQPINIEYNAEDWDAELDDLLREDDETTTPVAVVLEPRPLARSFRSAERLLPTE